jgi:hypothetical protein
VHLLGVCASLCELVGLARVRFAETEPSEKCLSLTIGVSIIGQRGTIAKKQVTQNKRDITRPFFCIQNKKYSCEWIK